MKFRFQTIDLCSLAFALLLSVLRPANAQTLPNGFKYTIQRRAESRLVAVDVWVRAGATAERRDEKGGAHFLEHTLFKGTTHRKSGETDFDIERLGGICQAGTGPDYVHLYATISPTALNAALEILDDILRNATLPSEEIERERRVILDELGKYEANLSNRLVARLYLEALPNSPYQAPPGGTPETIQRLQRAQLVAFYKRNYTPDRCTLVLTGDVEEAKAAEAIAKTFGDWKPASNVQEEAFAPLPERLAAVCVEVEVPPSDGVVALGWNAPPAKTAKMAACGRVIAEILGGSQAGRLAVPELSGAKALAQYTPRKETSLLYITAKLPALLSPPADQITRLESVVLNAVNSLEKRPVTSPELQFAKRQLAIRLRLDSETCMGLARLIGYADITEGEAPDAFKRTLELLAPKDIQEYVVQYLRPHQRVVVRYLPKSTLSGEGKP